MLLQNSTGYTMSIFLCSILCQKFLQFSYSLGSVIIYRSVLVRRLQFSVVFLLRNLWIVVVVVDRLVFDGLFIDCGFSRTESVISLLFFLDFRSREFFLACLVPFFCKCFSCSFYFSCFRLYLCRNISTDSKKCIQNRLVQYRSIFTNSSVSDQFCKYCFFRSFDCITDPKYCNCTEYIYRGRKYAKCFYSESEWQRILREQQKIDKKFVLAEK